VVGTNDVLEFNCQKPVAAVANGQCINTPPGYTCEVEKDERFITFTIDKA